MAQLSPQPANPVARRFPFLLVAATRSPATSVKDALPANVQMLVSMFDASKSSEKRQDPEVPFRETITPASSGSLLTITACVFKLESSRGAVHVISMIV